MPKNIAEKPSDHRYSIAIGAIVVLGAALLISILAPLTPFWGMAALSIQPVWFRVALVLISAAIALFGVHLISVVTGLIARITSRVQKIGVITATLAGLFTLFLWLSSETQVLGDGYTILAYIQKGILYKYTESLEILLHIGVTKLLKPFVSDPELKSFRLLSGMAGLLYAVGTFYLSKEMFDEIHGRALGVISFWSIGIVALFFGYVENYAFISATFPFVFYFALRFMRGQASIWAVLLSALLACGFHLSAISIMPGIAYLLFVKNKRNVLYRSRYPILVTFSMIVLILGSFVILSEKGHIFVSFTASESFPYTLLSAQHLWDLLSELALLSAFSIFMIAILIVGPKSRRNAKDVSSVPTFFFICAAATGLFTILIDPLLGSFRDWDLLAIYAVPLNAAVLSFARFRVNLKPLYKPLADASIAFLVFFTAPWVIFNHGPVKRVLPTCFDIVESDIHYSTDYDRGGRLLSWAVVASSVLQEYDEAIRITDRYLRVNPGHVGALHIQSFSHAKKGESEQALQLMQKILDSAPDNVEYVFQTARLAVQARRYELVEQLISRLPANRALHPKLVGVSACADYHLGRMEEAGRKFIQAISLGYDDPDGFLEYAAYLESVGMHDSSAVIRARSDSLLRALEAER
jgi:hypothetical protein